MPRQIRYNLPGIPQHVIQRSNNRQATFFFDEDYMRYLADLKSACDQHQCEAHAYVLMTNHVHLLMTHHYWPLPFSRSKACSKKTGRKLC